MTEKCAEEQRLENAQSPEAYATSLEKELQLVRRQLAGALARSDEIIQRAIKAESTKREFMARVSYSIRPPLNAIIGSSELLAQQEITNAQRQYVNLIQTCARELLDLVVGSMADLLAIEVDVPFARDRSTLEQTGIQKTSASALAPMPSSDKGVKIEAASQLGFRGQFSGHVLLADDNQIDRLIAHKLLTLLGAEVATARDGEEVIEVVRNHRFDLVFMDMEMPRKDGYETTRELRNLGLQMPIVALTAHAMKTDRDLCLAAGCDDYLAKPIEKHELLRVLTDYLKETVHETNDHISQTVTDLSAHIDINETKSRETQ